MVLRQVFESTVVATERPAEIYTANLFQPDVIKSDSLLSSCHAQTCFLVKQIKAFIWLCLLLYLSSSIPSLSLCVWVQASYCLGWQTKLRQGPLNVWWGNNWWNPASQHEREAVFLFWRVFMCALQRLSGSSSHCVAVWVCTLWDSCISRFEASVCVWGDEVRVGALVCGMTGWHHCVNEEREFNQRWMKWRSVLLARRKKSKLEKNEMSRCEWEND